MIDLTCGKLYNHPHGLYIFHMLMHFIQSMVYYTYKKR